MVSLLDIAPQTVQVHVNGSAVDVSGISAEGIVSLLQRFPELRKLISGKGIEIEDMVNLAPGIIAAVIAAGTGSIANAEAERIAANLAVEMQVEFLTKIGELTFPGGVGPFVERLKRMGGAFDQVAEFGKVAATK